MTLLSFAVSPSLDILGLLQLGQETHRPREGKRPWKEEGEEGASSSG